MKSMKLCLGLLAIALLPGLAHAQGAPNADGEGRLRGFEGEVVNSAGVPGEEGELTLRDHRTGEERVIRMTSVGGQPNFRIKTPGNSDVPDVARSMKPGAGVAVLARRVGGQWMAVEVLVKPQEPTNAPRTGVVMDSNPAEGTITILTSSGITRTLLLEAGARVPADGDVVIAFAGPSRRTSSSVGLERVRGLTRAAEVRERLERDLEAVTSGEGGLNGADPAVIAKHAESLMDLLDRQTSSHFERLEKALEHSNSGNRRALVEAIVHTKDARKQGRIKAEGARATIARDAARDAEDAAKDAAKAAAKGPAKVAKIVEDVAKASARPAEDVAREAEKAARDAARAAEDVAREAEEAARDAARAAEDAAREAEKTARDAARPAEDAAKEAEKTAQDAAKPAEDAAKEAEKPAQDAAKPAEDPAKDAEKTAQDAARPAEDAAKDAEKTAQDAANAAKDAARDAARAAKKGAAKKSRHGH